MTFHQTFEFISIIFNFIQIPISMTKNKSTSHTWSISIKAHEMWSVFRIECSVTTNLTFEFISMHCADRIKHKICIMKIRRLNELRIESKGKISNKECQKWNSMMCSAWYSLNRIKSLGWIICRDQTNSK